jgi:hypothetical protein
MRRETAVVLLAGGAVAVVLYNRTPAGHARIVGLLGVLFPKSRAGTGQVSGVQRALVPIAIPGYGQGLDDPGVFTLLQGTPELPYSGGGGMVESENVSVAVAGPIAVSPDLSSIAVGGLGVAPEDLTPAQIAAIALAPSLPGAKVQQAVLSLNPIAAIAQAIAAIVGKVTGMAVQGPTVMSLSVLGQQVAGIAVTGSNALGSALATIGGKVLGLLGVAVPGLPGIGLLTNLAAAVNAFAVGKATEAQLAAEGFPALSMSIGRAMTGMLADPSTIGTNLAATPAQIAANPNAGRVGAGPFSGVTFGQAGAVAGNPGAAPGLPGFTTAPMGFAPDTVAANGLPLFSTPRAVTIGLPSGEIAPAPASSGTDAPGISFDAGPGPTEGAPGPAAGQQGQPEGSVTAAQGTIGLPGPPGDAPTVSLSIDLSTPGPAPADAPDAGAPGDAGGAPGDGGGSGGAGSGGPGAGGGQSP